MSESNSSSGGGISFSTVLVTMIIVVGTVIALTYLPINPDNSSYRYNLRLEPQSEDTRHVIVPAGYTVSGSYSVDSDYPVQVTIFYGYNLFTPPDKVVFRRTSNSGSYEFTGSALAPGGKYFFEIKNPEDLSFWDIFSSDLHEITVTISIKVPGWTTWI